MYSSQVNYSFLFSEDAKKRATEEEEYKQSLIRRAEQEELARKRNKLKLQVSLSFSSEIDFNYFFGSFSIQKIYDDHKMNFLKCL